MSKERFEVFGNIIKDNKQIPNLLDNYKATIRLNEFAQRISELEEQLQSLADYTQASEKEVIEQVKDYMKKHIHTIPVISKNRKVVYNIGLTRFLDQIEKGEVNG